MLTATAIAVPAARQAAHCSRAWSSTHVVSARIRPASSASGRNLSGGIRPRLGCCHRTSASTARSRRCAGRAAAGSAGRAGPRRSRPAAPRRAAAVAMPSSSSCSYTANGASPSFARYIATSAQPSSPALSVASAGAMAIPMLAPIVASTTPRTKGCRDAGRQPLGDRRSRSRRRRRSSRRRTRRRRAGRRRRSRAGAVRRGPSWRSSSSPAG